MLLDQLPRTNEYSGQRKDTDSRLSVRHCATRPTWTTPPFLNLDFSPRLSFSSPFPRFSSLTLTLLLSTTLALSLPLFFFHLSIFSLRLFSSLLLFSTSSYSSSIGSPSARRSFSPFFFPRSLSPSHSLPSFTAWCCPAIFISLFLSYFIIICYLFIIIIIFFIQPQ